jgi:hypothetical protein
MISRAVLLACSALIWGIAEAYSPFCNPLSSHSLQQRNSAFSPHKYAFASYSKAASAHAHRRSLLATIKAGTTGPAAPSEEKLNHQLAIILSECQNFGLCRWIIVSCPRTSVIMYMETKTHINEETIVDLFIPSLCFQGNSTFSQSDSATQELTLFCWWRAIMMSHAGESYQCRHS